MLTRVIEFETPENVRIGYPVAGPGTRFLAWLLDQVLVLVLCVVVCAGLLAAGVASGVFEGWMQDAPAGNFEQQTPQFTMYFVGGSLLVLAFGSFVYYFASELVLRGQTLGKRLFGLRVVKADGFALDPLSLFIRNAFRGVDHLAPLWLVPLLSTRTQRPGDMAAGTLVISERTPELSRLRRELSARPPLEARHRFETSPLLRLRPVDVAFVETLLEHWDELPLTQLERLCRRATPALCRRLSVSPPRPDEEREFLQDLLAAEYRRRSHSVG